MNDQLVFHKFALDTRESIKLKISERNSEAAEDFRRLPTPSPVCGRLAARVFPQRGAHLVRHVLRLAHQVSVSHVKALQSGETARSSRSSPLRRARCAVTDDDDAPLLPPPTHNPLRSEDRAPPADAQSEACHVDGVCLKRFTVISLLNKAHFFTK